MLVRACLFISCGRIGLVTRIRDLRSKVFSPMFLRCHLSLSLSLTHTCTPTHALSIPSPLLLIYSLCEVSLHTNIRTRNQALFIHPSSSPPLVRFEERDRLSLTYALTEAHTVAISFTAPPLAPLVKCVRRSLTHLSLFLAHTGAYYRYSFYLPRPRPFDRCACAALSRTSLTFSHTREHSLSIVSTSPTLFPLFKSARGTLMLTDAWNRTLAIPYTPPPVAPQ